MSILGRILDVGRDDESIRKSSRIKPSLRLSAAVLCILLCALSHNAVFVTAVIAVQLVRAMLLPPRRLAGVLKRLLPAVVFTALIMLPSVFMGHQKTALTVTMKVTESVLVLLMLNEELDWREVTAAFRALHMPDIFTVTLDMTVRFLVLLGRYANAMLEAISLRSFGAAESGNRDRLRMKAAGGVLGTTFLVSQRMASETWEAMECRGFTGEYPETGRRGTKAPDLIYALVVPLMIVFFVICEKAI